MTSLAAAILALLLAQPDGVRACDTEPHCYELAHDIASACESAGRATGINPWTLAAIAHAETRFDASRKGWRGAGLWGLNPRGRSFRESRMFCSLNVARCMTIEAAVAGAYLAEERRRCGSEDGALRSYGSGRCEGVKGNPNKYVRAVRASLARLRGAK